MEKTNEEKYEIVRELFRSNNCIVNVVIEKGQYTDLCMKIVQFRKDDESFYLKHEDFFRGKSIIPDKSHI